VLPAIAGRAVWDGLAVTPGSLLFMAGSYRDRLAKQWFIGYLTGAADAGRRPRAADLGREEADRKPLNPSAVR
jgi:hypothetical protein